MLDVTLISHTNDPIGTLYRIWEASKTDRDFEEISGSGTSGDKIELFRKLMKAQVPVIENIDFVFLLENVPISFREQMVRHRIGVHVGDRMGVDIVPDLADSTFWSQSMRIINMGSFATDKDFFVPEEVEGNEEAKLLFDDCMVQIENAYNNMVKLGVPLEQAREVIPLGATHRISWKLNLAALLHIIGRRSCWILQAGYWHKIIGGMINALRTEVHSVFQDLADPPCIKNGVFQECVQVLDNERRVDNRDSLLVCPLYCHYHMGEDTKKLTNVPLRDDPMVLKWSKFWNRDPWTGERFE